MSSAFNRWNDLANALPGLCSEAVSQVARAGKEHVQEHIRANNQIRTGRMLNGIYASTPEGSDYAGGEKALPEEKPSSDTEAIVGAATEYSIFNEMGTVHMSAKPFFIPGFDDTRSDLDQAMQQLAQKLEDKAQ